LRRLKPKAYPSRRPRH